MTFGKRFCVIVTIFLFPLFSGLLAASQAAATSNHLSTELDYLSELPVVLSATRLEQNILEVPSSTTIITREMIEATGAIDIVDILRLVPGFQVTHPSGNRSAVTSHGLPEAYPRRLLVLIDGRSTYRPLLSNVDWTQLGLAIEDIEKIEVIRGPNVTTHGTNAFIGTVNFITRRPFQDEGAYVRVRKGAIKTRDLVARYAGSSKDFEYRLTAGYREDVGFDDLAGDEIRTGTETYDERLNDEKTVRQFSFRGIYTPDSSDVYDIQIGYSGGAQGAEGSLDPAKPFDPVREKEISSSYGLVKWSHTISSEQDLYIKFYQNENEIEDLYSFLFFGFPVEFGFYDAQATRSDLEFQHTYINNENKLRVAWGGSLREDKVKSKLYYDSNDYFSDRSKRLFANVELFLTDALVTNLGIMVENTELSESVASHRLAFNYLLSPVDSFRLNISKANRLPSIHEVNVEWLARVSTNNALIDIISASDDNLKEEELTSYELGYAYANKKNHSSVDVRLYREELRDPIITRKDFAYTSVPAPITDDGSFVWINDRDSVVVTTGLEVQYSYQPAVSDFFKLQYAYAEMDGQYKYIVNNTPPNAAETFRNVENLVPASTVSALWSHQYDRDINAGIAFYHLTGFKWGGDGDTLPSYNRFDLNIKKSFKWGEGVGHIGFMIHNILDSEYEEFEFENIFKRRTYVQLDFQY